MRPAFSAVSPQIRPNVYGRQNGLIAKATRGCHTIVCIPPTRILSPLVTCTSAVTLGCRTSTCAVRDDWPSLHFESARGTQPRGSIRVDATRWRDAALVWTFTLIHRCVYLATSFPRFGNRQLDLLVWAQPEQMVISFPFEHALPGCPGNVALKSLLDSHAQCS